MKKIVMLFFMSLSLTSFSYENSDFESECATRYIQGAEDLVRQAEDFNTERISAAEYALNIALTDGTIMSLRLACMGESLKVEKCVERSKPGYEKIRNKMQVKEVLEGKVDHVKVNELDLLRQFNSIIACRNFI
jgi:hypothetical protein